MTNIQVPAPIEEKIQKEYPVTPEEFEAAGQSILACHDMAEQNEFIRKGINIGYGLAWQWIPVEERLPEWGEKVLVAIDTGEICDGWYSGSMKYFVVRGERFDKETSIGHYITHWMPLPQPPQQ